MRICVVLLLLVTLAVAMAASTSFSEKQEWEKFKDTFKKKYASADEEEYRKGVFKKCKDDIEKHNEKYKKGEVTYSLKVTRYCDFTQDEIRKKGFIG